MKALMKMDRGADNLVIVEVATPVPQEHEVLIRVSGCGLCGTDLSLFEGSEALEQQFKPRYPLIIGHEFVGEVVEAGSGVARSRIGEKVVVNPHLTCGVCEQCQRGREELCSNRELLSWHLPGGAAEFVAVRADNAYVMDSASADRVGVLAEPLAVAVHALDGMALRREAIVILGAGTIGCLALIYATALHISDVVMVGLPADRDRLELARDLGATTVTLPESRPAKDEVAKVLGALGGGAHAGCDAVVEASGGADALRFALELVRPGGQVGALGIPHDPVPIDVGEVVLAEKEIRGIRGYTPRTWQKVVELMPSMQSQLARLITRSEPLGSYAVGFQALAAREGIKVVLRP